MKTTNHILATAIATLFIAPAAFATNGMNMEGYGPVSTAMGGTAQAYNNGLGGMMNNPATMGWGCDKNCAKLSIGLGVLQPTVKSDMPAGSGMPSSSSDGTSYLTPAIGYATKQGRLTYGVGVMAQGGMGTEYSATTALGGMSGGMQRSEVSVGRLILPLAFEVNQNLQIAGSIDYVLAGMDLKMTNPANGAYLNASNGDAYSGEMKGTGWGAKLGLVYKVSKEVDIGASYHTKTSLSDLTGSGTVNMMGMNMPVDVKIVDFQWPETFGIGVAYRPNADWMLAFDVKKIMWSNTMKNFKMEMTIPGMGTMPDSQYQGWDDQTIIMLGAAYNLNKNLTLRAGINQANHPVPSNTINPLFPAIVERHYTMGVGYKVNDNHQLDASAVIAPEVSQTSTTNGMTASHGQLNFQMLYTYSF